MSCTTNRARTMWLLACALMPVALGVSISNASAQEAERRLPAGTAEARGLPARTVPAGGSPLVDQRLAAAPVLTVPPISSQPSGVEPGITGGDVFVSDPVISLPDSILNSPAVLTTPEAVPERKTKLAQITGGVPLQPQVVPVRMQPVCVHHQVRGFWGRIFGGILRPVVGGLDETSCGLHTTAGAMRGLEQPLDRLASPLGGLATPLGGLAEPMRNLAEPLTGLSQPITGLQAPVHELSQSAAGLAQPVSELGHDMTGLERPLIGMQHPLEGMAEPLRALPGPLTGLAEPLRGLQEPLLGLQRPLTGLATPINGLQNEMHDLRAQITTLEKTIVDIGRNITLAIVFGSSIVAYAIWTHRKVPAVTEPTVTTMETQPIHDETGDHNATIIKTQCAPHAPHGAAPKLFKPGEHPPAGSPPHGPQPPQSPQPPHDEPPQGQQPPHDEPPSPPPNIIQPPGE